MKRHVQMFNTNCDWGSVIHGIIISLEEQRAMGNEEITPEMMESLKIGEQRMANIAFYPSPQVLKQNLKQEALLQHLISHSLATQE